MGGLAGGPPDDLNGGVGYTEAMAELADREAGRGRADRAEDTAAALAAFFGTTDSVALMMLAHGMVDPEANKHVLVPHAFIVAGGEITKASAIGQRGGSHRGSAAFSVAVRGYR